MDRELQSKICWVLMVLNGVALRFDPVFTFQLTHDMLTADDMQEIMACADEYDWEKELEGKLMNEVKEDEDGNVHVEW